MVLILVQGCAGRLVIRTVVQPVFVPTRYARMAVFASSPDKTEQSLAEQIYFAFMDMGIRAIGQSQIKSLLTEAGLGRSRKIGSSDLRQAKDLAKLIHADAVALISLDFRQGLSVVSMTILDLETGEAVLRSDLEYEGGMLEGPQPRKLAVAITEDMKAKLFSNNH